MNSNNKSPKNKKTQKKTIKDEQLKTLGLKIAFYRKRKQYTQLQLAEKIDISRTYLSNIESASSTVNPTLDVIIDIAIALEVPASKLFDNETL